MLKNSDISLLSKMALVIKSDIAPYKKVTNAIGRRVV